MTALSGPWSPDASQVRSPLEPKHVISLHYGWIGCVFLQSIRWHLHDREECVGDVSLCHTSPTNVQKRRRQCSTFCLLDWLPEPIDWNCIPIWGLLLPLFSRLTIYLVLRPFFEHLIRIGAETNTICSFWCWLVRLAGSILCVHSVGWPWRFYLLAEHFGNLWEPY